MAAPKQIKHVGARPAGDAWNSLSQTDDASEERRQEQPD